MAFRLYRLSMVALLLAASVTLPTAPTHGQEEPQQEQLTLQELQREKEELLKQLGGQQECQQKVKGLEKQNGVLHSKVDKDTPALERITKEAAERLSIVQADASRWLMYFRLVILALVITWGNSALGLIKDGINKLKPTAASDSKPSKPIKKKNK